MNRILKAHNMRKTFILYFLFSVLVISCDRKVETYDNYVILVSFDGCRWDYIDMYDTPNLNKMASEGVKAERVISSFPTKTFPNHYTIATGLYPDHHGIINNSFYAPDLDLRYRIGDRKMVENGDFYGGEPIWNTAEKQGVKAASFFWVGSEAPIQGMQPSYWKAYDGSVPFRARVDTVIHWLKLPLEKRPRLLLLYFQQPDGVGHDYGPVSSETGEVMEEMDRVLGYLRKKIDRLPYGDKVNLIVTSDHGMGAVSPDRYVNINDYLKDAWVDDLSGGNPVYLLEPVNGYKDSALHALESVKGISAYTKENIPEHMHYGTNPRVPEIVLIADSSWSIGLKPDPSSYSGGAHGYDNRNSDMHNIFIAEGPAFKQGYVQAPFENVNIYPLIIELLGIEPAPCDGNLDHVRGMLR